jgi:hypothetical protein
MSKIERYSHIRTGRWLVVLALLAVLSLTACQPPDFLQGELPDDGPPVAVSQAAARNFAEKVAAAGEAAAQSKRLSLTVTQEEVTSFLSLTSQLSEQMQAVEATSLQDLDQLAGAEELPPWLRVLAEREELANVRLPDVNFRVSVQEPEVRFRGNGQIIIRGYGEALGVQQPLRIVLAPSVSDGALILDFVEGTLGPVPVPEGLIDQAGEQLATLIMAGADYVQVTRVDVAAGTLTVAGRYTQ